MTPLTNDHRAIIGVAAVEAALERFDLLLSEHESDWDPEVDDVMVTAIEDTLACIAHTCDRYGVPPADVFQDALKRHSKRVLTLGQATTVADGDYQSLAEARKQILQEAVPS